MDVVIEEKRTIPVYDEVDVVVCGGGVAGVAAATCAARHGARVILLERYGYLGGLATGGLVITVPPLDNGINSEVRRRLEEARTYQECANLGDDPAVDGLIAVDPEILKFELLTLLLDSGCRAAAPHGGGRQPRRRRSRRRRDHREQGGAGRHPRPRRGRHDAATATSPRLPARPATSTNGPCR